ncbi:uncharacterized protein LOC126267741 [Schistocerca gregaria]|uniref:uncharacterized protein LOC126267741 n=1 Tax=Schistocerca gregaria TaxID=7010 RepID=UPI00211E3ACD|nr:uncharacterized protein LOC126267741 [Schistocerca gregaria]
MIGSSVMCPVTYLQLQRHIMCSNGGMYQGVCRGDEGGAVIANYPLLGFVLMAVVKGKVPAARVTEPPERVMDPTCGVPTGASMYTFVGYYREWLLENIADARIYEYWKPYLGNSTVYGNSVQSGNRAVKGNQVWKQGLELREESTGSSGAMALMSLRLFVVALCLLLLPAERCGWQSLSAV